MDLGDDQAKGGKIPTLNTTLSSRYCRNMCTQSSLMLNGVVPQVPIYMDSDVSGPKSNNSRWEQCHYELQLRFVQLW